MPLEIDGSRALEHPSPSPKKKIIPRRKRPAFMPMINLLVNRSRTSMADSSDSDSEGFTITGHGELPLVSRHVSVAGEARVLRARLRDWKKKAKQSKSMQGLESLPAGTGQGEGEKPVLEIDTAVVCLQSRR